MMTLVVGGSGATGMQLVEQLLKMGGKVKVIVRSLEKLPESWNSADRLSIIQASVLEISVNEMAGHLHGCDAVACCLGHNMSLKGMYGAPRRLVEDAVRLLSQAIKLATHEKPVKFVLMNTAGNRNRDLDEPVSMGERLLIGLLRLCLPPHVDNEKAADYFRMNIGQTDTSIEWVIVRPDNLIDEGVVTQYEVYPSPTRSAIFDPGKTSRINVAHFMAELITDNVIWTRWKGQMPVIYNKPNQRKG